MCYADKKLSETKVFKDPVHRYIHVDDQVVWDLVGTAEFQRLRRIKQLGTTYTTFHGAEHSRFGHSLGVYEIIRRMIDDVFTGREGWNPADRLLCLCAALLHDVGHGPFSHSFEKVFAVDHEEFTQRMIVGDTEINNVLKQVSTEFPQQVADIIGKKSNNKLAISMISSQIDADRMDYLLRDAYFTGVSYGKFDLERLLRVMRPLPQGIAVKKSGMHAVEHYIISRYQMYWQVYFHPVTRSAEVLLNSIFKRVRYLYQEEYRFQHQPVHFYSIFDGKISVEDYLQLDENIMMYYFQVWQKEDDTILADLCRRFLHRHLLKYVDFTDDFQKNNWVELEHLCKKAEIDPKYYVVVDSISDLPYDFYRSEDDDGCQPILLLMPDGKLRELSRESHLVEAMSRKEQTDRKLYYPYEMIDDNTHHTEMKSKIRRILDRSK